MKRVLILLSFVMAALSLAGFSDPVIVVDNAVWNVSIQTESLIAHTFTLSNVGDETLIISDVVPSCSCTAATLETYELEPGQSVELPITIDTAGFEGLVLRLIDIFSNDPANPIFTLTMNIDAPEHADHAETAILSLRDFMPYFYALIDVRTPTEYEAGHLFGAVNIPLSELEENLDAWIPGLPTDIPMIVYCKIGVRSATATLILLDAGFVNVVDLAGGMDEWIATYGEGYLFDPT